MIGSVTQKLQKKYYSLAVAKQWNQNFLHQPWKYKNTCINKIETKFLDQENPNQGLRTMLHYCINLYITHAIISEKLIVFKCSGICQNFTLCKAKICEKKSLGLLLKCYLSNVKKLGKKQCQRQCVYPNGHSFFYSEIRDFALVTKRSFVFLLRNMKFYSCT